MKMQVIFVGEYELSGDPEKRRELYGTADPSECARIDAMADPFELFTYCDQVAIVSVVPETQPPAKVETETS